MLHVRCFVTLLLLVQLKYDADMAFSVRRRCLLFSLCVSSPFSLAIWSFVSFCRLSFLASRSRLPKKDSQKIMTVDEDAENLRIDVDVETVVCAGCGGGCTSMCTGLVLFALSLVVVVVVCRKQIAARKIVTVDEDRKFASPEISMSVRISKDAEDLASRVVLLVVDRSRSR